MTSVSLRQYRDLVSRSGLLTDDAIIEQFDEYCHGDTATTGVVDSDTEPEGFAHHLEQVGLLTQWQNAKLLKGKFRGLVFGKFRILRLLGTGGMGRVFLAENEMLQRQVALKVLPSKLSRNESMIQRFHREARALAKLNHVNIVRIHDVDVNENMHYIVMEYVDGHDLQRRVTDDGPLSVAQAIDYTRQAARGLHHAHEAGLVHRDVKPGNILVNDKGIVKILDLGLAIFQSAEDSGITQDPTKGIGTVDYISPEQALHSQNVDARTDVYSLGCSLYFLLTGNVPFNEGSVAQRLMAHQTATPRAINEVRAERKLSPLNEQLVRICTRMMAKKPADRFASAALVDEALSYLDRAEHSSGQAPPMLFNAPPTRPPRSSSGTPTRTTPANRRPVNKQAQSNRNRTIFGIAGGGVAAAALVGGITFFYSEDVEQPPAVPVTEQVVTEQVVTEQVATEQVATEQVATPPQMTGFVVVGDNTTYHEPECRHVSGRDNLHQVSQNNLDSGLLKPCRVCNPGS